MSPFWIVCLVVAIAALFIWRVHNRLMTLDSRCEQAFADIDVQLKQRHALLPNLLEMVKGFVKHESEAIENVTKARAAVFQAASPPARMQAETTLGVGLRLARQEHAGGVDAPLPDRELHRQATRQLSLFAEGIHGFPHAARARL